MFWSVWNFTRESNRCPAVIAQPSRLRMMNVPHSVFTVPSCRRVETITGFVNSMTFWQASANMLPTKGTPYIGS